MSRKAHRSHSRHVNASQFIDVLLQDLRFGIRTLWKKPAFAIVSVLALALGIGANSTVYSTLSAMVLRPLAFKDLDRILTVSENVPRQGWDGISVAPANYRSLVELNTVFQKMAALQGAGWDANVTGVGAPNRLEGYLVTPGFFDLLEMQPLLGRTFSESETGDGGLREAVISYAVWQKHFGADKRIVGRTIVLNGSQATVIGVMPKEFDFPIGAEIWAPVPMHAPEMSSRSDHTLTVIGRLKANTSLQQARAEMNAIAWRLQQQYPATNAGRGFTVGLLRKDALGETRQYILVLMWAAAFVLLLACANVANLQLARAIGQQKEMAVRAALGAPRWRIAYRVLAESLVLSVAGALLGLLLASWAIPATRASVPPFIVQHIAGVRNIKLDGGVIAFTAGVALLSGILTALIPAWHACSSDVSTALNEAVRGSSSGSVRRRSRSLLVVTEVALALILLVGASLMVKGFNRLVSQYPGYDASAGLTMRVTLPESKYGNARVRADFYERAVDKLAALPGVEAAAAATYLPSGWSWRSGSFTIENVPPMPDAQPRAAMHPVSPAFLQALEIPLRSGRFLSRQDGFESTPVVVVTETMARRYWPGRDPIGQRIRFAPGEPFRTIVGVVGDIRQGTFDEGFRSTAYVPMAQTPPQSAGFILRTSGDPMSFASAARTAIQGLDRDQAVYDVRTLRQLINDNASGVQYVARMMFAFAIIALLLAAAGIYAVMAYAVLQRTHEIGIRMALGAQPANILRMIVGDSLKLALWGLVIGVPLAFLMMRTLSGLLVGVVRLEVATLIWLTALLLLVGILAGYIPARHAAHVPPTTSLREE